MGNYYPCHRWVGMAGNLCLSLVQLLERNCTMWSKMGYTAGGSSLEALNGLKVAFILFRNGSTERRGRISSNLPPA